MFKQLFLEIYFYFTVLLYLGGFLSLMLSPLYGILQTIYQVELGKSYLWWVGASAGAVLLAIGLAGLSRNVDWDTIQSNRIIGRGQR